MGSQRKHRRQVSDEQRLVEIRAQIAARERALRVALSTPASPVDLDRLATPEKAHAPRRIKVVNATPYEPGKFAHKQPNFDTKANIKGMDLAAHATKKKGGQKKQGKK